MKNKSKNSYKYTGIDFVGQRHGRLAVTGKAERGRSWWHCKCDCGKSLDLPTWKFLAYQSCGCLEKENLVQIGKNNKTHGKTETALYRVWCKMKERCYNPNIEHYPNYGGRGISVCDDWVNSFENFQVWAYSAGYNDGLNGRQQSLDRIDVNGNYEPSNCRWITHKEQMRNTTRTVYIESGNAKMAVSEFCEKYNITDHKLVSRYLKLGYTAEEILRIWGFRNGKHDGYYSMLEASEYYGVSTQSIKQWIDKGWIKAERIGQHWFIPEGQTVSRRADRDNNGRFVKNVNRPRGIVELE